MSDRVTVSLAQGIADVRLNRPDKLNALDAAMFEALVETGRGLRAERGLRAVVLSGEGRGFCAGLDVASFMGGGGGRSLFERSAESPANFAQRAAWIWTELPVPVIAAIHGVAFGGGLQIALGADIRFVAPDARLSVMEIKWGLIPDMSGSQTLRRLVRLDVAKELTFTGRVVSGTRGGRAGPRDTCERHPARGRARARARDRREVSVGDPGRQAAARRVGLSSTSRRACASRNGSRPRCSASRIRSKPCARTPRSASRASATRIEPSFTRAAIEPRDAARRSRWCRPRGPGAAHARGLHRHRRAHHRHGGRAAGGADGDLHDLVAAASEPLAHALGARQEARRAPRRSARPRPCAAAPAARATP